MHIHEQRMVQSGAMMQEMAQCVNALTNENNQKKQIIESLAMECKAQTEVLLRHQMGQ